MERRRNRQRQRTLGTVCLEDLAGLFDRRLAAGNHGLGWIVEVHRLHNLQAGATERCLCLGTASNHFRRIHAQDGGHRTGSHRHRFLHRRRPEANQRGRLRQTQDTRGHERRILAQ
ncbi:hypothetical protein D9M69_468730 [compost metagenome]